MKSLFKVLAFAALLFAGTTLAQSFTDLLAQANQSVSTFTADGGATQANADAAAQAIERARAAATTAAEIEQANTLAQSFNTALSNSGLAASTTVTYTAAGASTATTVSYATWVGAAIATGAAYQMNQNQKSP